MNVARWSLLALLIGGQALTVPCAADPPPPAPSSQTAEVSHVGAGPAGAKPGDRRVTTGPPLKRKLADPMVDDHLGVDVAIDADTAIVNALDGSFIFERDAGGPGAWGQVALTSEGAIVDSVSISGDTVALGDRQFRRGYVYLHQRDAGGPGNWGSVGVIVYVLRNSGFGQSVSLSGDTLIVGGSPLFDIAQVHGRDVGGPDGWGLLADLSRSDAPCYFGWSVAISGDTAVVGEPCPASAGIPGRAHVFERNAGGTDAWGAIATLTASDGDPTGSFGTAVAIDADAIVVAALDADGPVAATGAAYVYGREVGDSDDWGPVAKLTGYDTTTGDGFGSVLSIDGGRVTAATYDTNTGTGATYVFERYAGGPDAWGQVARLTSPPGSGTDAFGNAAVSGGTVVVGAADDDEVAENSGAFYVFSLFECGLDEGVGTSCPCGNGELDGDEECDDGNTIDGDGCSQTCTQEICDDFDGDGFGRLGRPDCPGGTVRDCDDEDASVYPGAPQSCEGVNNDCNAPDWPVVDGDADDFAICEGDCDDDDATTYPGAEEVCDGARNDCSAPDWPTVPADEVDGDLDGYVQCEDCDDVDPAVNPGATEVCNDIDDDCNGLIDDDENGENNDLDRWRNRCDNCIWSYNPGQSDIDGDGEGDLCDLDDGVIYLEDRPAYPDVVIWQDESGFDGWNLYRGDLAALRAGGPYTQAPDDHVLADRFCDVGLAVDDPILPAPREVAFYLVTGTLGPVEGDLGTDGDGNLRPNDNPCPPARGH